MNASSTAAATEPLLALTQLVLLFAASISGGLAPCSNAALALRSPSLERLHLVWDFCVSKCLVSRLSSHSHIFAAWWCSVQSPIEFISLFVKIALLGLTFAQLFLALVSKRRLSVLSRCLGVWRVPTLAAAVARSRGLHLACTLLLFLRAKRLALLARAGYHCAAAEVDVDAAPLICLVRPRVPPLSRRQMLSPCLNCFSKLHAGTTDLSLEEYCTLRVSELPRRSWRAAFSSGLALLFAVLLSRALLSSAR